MDRSRLSRGQLTPAFSRAALATAAATAQLAEQLVVLSMGPDPEPHQTVGRFHGKRSMMRTYTGRPEAPNLLDAKRWMPRISLQVRERSLRELAHRRR